MKLSFAFLVLLFACNCYGQKAAFTVIDLTGDVQFVDKHKPIKVGTTLDEGDRINVKNGKALLVCGSSSYVKLEAAGLYVLNSKTLCKTAENSAFASILKYKWEELMQKEDNNEWRNHLDNIGAVYRGNDNCACQVDVNLKYINYFSGDFNLSWSVGNTKNPLFLKIYANTAKKPILSIPVSTNHYPLNDLKKQLGEGKKYFWVVVASDEQCMSFNTLDFTTEIAYQSVISSVTTSVNNNISDKAEQQYLQGVLLETKHFFAEAFNCFKEANRISPENQKYINELKDFKHRYQMEQ